MISRLNFYERAKSIKDSLFTTGFNDWKNGNSAVGSHENFLVHTTCLMELRKKRKYQNACKLRYSPAVGRREGLLEECLIKVAATIKLLTVRGLPLRGSDEQIGLIRNCNFLVILELRAKFDPFLNEHLKRSKNIRSGGTSYFSKRICDEFIEVMAQKLKTEILETIRAAKYFSISVDSTPDLAHIDLHH
ncbi:hypothetical protein NQ314_015344 [Rhamnusium bicolor]|uniref:DUF4371 domain-containing protein n=1 Tax=Rhamnusium bicolor TaxID=1586634 RepID=A0AAV8WYY9_9CUCU|nr:hypothetical protein NQ314_015344 [Rhamnusium bicolor]